MPKAAIFLLQAASALWQRQYLVNKFIFPVLVSHSFVLVPLLYLKVKKNHSTNQVINRDTHEQKTT